MPTYEYRCPHCGPRDINKPVGERARPECCPRCATPMRRIYTAQGFIMRPSGYRLKPGDRGFDDFRREHELGELRDDPTPLKFTPEELARMDEMPMAIAPDPERDHQFAQLIHQHWTEDLSDDTVRRRDLEAQHYATAHGQPAAG